MRRPVDPIRVREREANDRIVQRVRAVQTDPLMRICALCPAVINVWASGERTELDGSPHLCSV